MPEQFLPYALEEATDEQGRPCWLPIECPPCGQRLDLDDNGVHLVCDKPAGHNERASWPPNRHRQVLAAHEAAEWCVEGCAHVCSGPQMALAYIRGYAS
jgi:hypothetical protein